MNKESQAAKIQSLAIERAKLAFKEQDISITINLDPRDDDWAQLNIKIPENKHAPVFGEIDNLFLSMFRATMLTLYKNVIDEDLRKRTIQFYDSELKEKI